MTMTFTDNEVYQQELEEMCKLPIPYEQLQNQSILITGANGLICSYFIDALMKMNQLIEEKIKDDSKL